MNPWCGPASNMRFPVAVEAEQPAVVDDDAAERDLVVGLAGGGRGAADEIHLAVRGAGAGPVPVEQQPRRLAVRIEEELEPAAYPCRSKATGKEQLAVSPG